MYPYRIRLRGPWEYEIVNRVPGRETAASQGHMTMPCRLVDAGLHGFAGTIRFRRRFGIPRTLDSHERVWLVVEGASGCLTIDLNGKHIVDQQNTQAVACEVTNLLRDRNELAVELRAQNDQDGLVGETCLEIRCLAYLEHVHFSRTTDGRLRVSAQLVGETMALLDLYLLADGRTQAQSSVRGCRGHRSITLESSELVGEGEVPGIACLELVQGALLWFRAEGRVI